MFVNTPKGVIKVIPSSDLAYPGIWVRINDEELVLVEYDSVRESHVIRVWRAGGQEECEYIQAIGEEVEENA